MKPSAERTDRNYWMAMGIFAVCTLLLIFINRRPGRSDYQLRFWLGYLASDRPERQEMATAALREMSATAVPQLVRMVASGDTNLQAQAVLGFVALDGHARAAIPQLGQLLWNETSSLAASRALAGIGRAAFPVLTNALRAPVRYVRSNAARGIGLLRAEARPAVPMLVNVLDDRDEALRWAASRALGHIAAEPAQAVPALLTRLDDQSIEVRKMAIISLGKFHEQARAAIPALRRKALHGSTEEIRNAALFALKEVDPGVIVTRDLN